MPALTAPHCARRPARTGWRAPATLVVDAMFPLLALSTLAYELWIAALAWHWLRSPPPRT